MNASGESYSIRRLATLFAAWKCLVISLAFASPGPGYDTSTGILFDQYASASVSKTWLARILDHLTLRLTRWDGLYFAVNAERGHVNEQDWAFSWALARFTDAAAEVLFSSSSMTPIVKRALTGILISNISHFLAVVTLYKFTQILLLTSQATKAPPIAFTAAVLHTVSPAGIFLSAPYGESIFAFLNFAGTFWYTYASQLRRHAATTAVSPGAIWPEIVFVINSGLLFGLATTVRGNGLLNGVLFLWDAVELVLQPARLFHSGGDLLRLAAIVLAGVLTGAGFAGPQIVAYKDFCTGGDYKETRPWCDKIPPSIYDWVQHHYWGVGLFRYWTLSNLPLFLIAAPVLGLLLWTDYVCLLHPESVLTRAAPPDSSIRKQELGSSADTLASESILRRLALPQLALALMAATSFHVQIINRISSGYPLWYIVLATALHSKTSTNAETPASASSVGDGHVKIRKNGSTKAGVSMGLVGSLQRRDLQWLVRGIVMYAIIQGGLYASFLPPA